MGLMDKVKAQASTLAQSANAGMAKLDNLPAQRRADALLRSLGLAILAERTGRATADTTAQINQILADLAQHEAQNNVNLVQQAAQAQAQAQQQQQMQMQQPGDFLTGAPTPDPNVPGAPAPGYGGAPAYGGQPGFPQGGQPGFPGAAPTSFPQQGGQPGFPQADPTGFPQAAPASFPQQGGSTGFPEAIPVTSFPPASPVAAPGATDEGDAGQSQSGFPGSSFPPSSGA